MARLYRLCVLSAAIALAAPPGVWAQSPCQGVELGQGWSDAQRQTFWFLSQGSRLVDYQWFVSLEEASSSALFKDGLARFGFVPARQSNLNPDGLPIGFTRDRPGPAAAVGLTCAACHTSRLSLQGTPVIIEGGTTLADFELFTKQLEAAMDTNGTDAGKFDRFATRVLGGGASQADKDRLKQELAAATTTLSKRWNAHWPATPSGPGRVDAFGAIYNQVVAYAIGAPREREGRGCPGLLSLSLERAAARRRSVERLGQQRRLRARTAVAKRGRGSRRFRRSEGREDEASPICLQPQPDRTCGVGRHVEDAAAAGVAEPLRADRSESGGRRKGFCTRSTARHATRPWNARTRPRATKPA